jgi:hypothetical protein
MGWTTRALIFATAAGSGAAATGALLNRRQNHGEARSRSGRRWHTITVNRDIGEVTPGGRLPRPLADLTDVEVNVRRAPGSRGTEIAVRLLAGDPSDIMARFTGNDPRHAVRRALRESRSLLETGEILLPDAPSTTRRTLLNKPLEYATTHGREEGLL